MASKDFKVGDWIVRPDRLRIYLPGETVHITPKSMAVLQCLADAGGEVVSRNNILDRVWPGAEVTDDVLTHCVTELRKAFGDSAHDPKVIETIPRKGIRLLAPVSELEEERASGRPTRAFAAAIVALVLVGVAGVVFLHQTLQITPDTPITIAVLPIVDMSQGEDQQYLADGLSEELTHRLSNLEGLQVFGPRSISLFAAATDDRRAIARQLDCDFVLDGSVRRSADELRVTARLVDIDNGIQLWSHTFDRPYADALEIQDEIAAAVAKALSVKLGVGRAETRIGSTSNVAAFEQVWLGDSYFDLTPSGLEKALSHYRNAAELDPDYAFAWQRIAEFYCAIVYVSDRSDADEYLELADDAISRAMELVPDSGRVLMTAATVQFMQQNWVEARRLFDRAKAAYGRRANGLFVDVSTMDVHVNMLLKLGYMSEQIRLLERVSQGQRLGGLHDQFLPQAYLSAGRIDDALAELERAFSAPPVTPTVSYVGVSVALTLDDPALIRLWSQRLLEHAELEGRKAIATMLELLGDRERALAWLREAYATDRGDDDIVIVWASYYGDNELALKAMRRSMDLWFFWIPLLAHARETAEFKSIVRDAGLVDYWREYGWNDYCSPTQGDDFVCQ